jgi:hypothetical protein
LAWGTGAPRINHEARITRLAPELNVRYRRLLKAKTSIAA